jgi:hypothetical protein
LLIENDQGDVDDEGLGDVDDTGLGDVDDDGLGAVDDEGLGDVVAGAQVVRQRRTPEVNRTEHSKRLKRKRLPQLTEDSGK